MKFGARARMTLIGQEAQVPERGGRHGGVPGAQPRERLALHVWRVVTQRGDDDRRSPHDHCRVVTHGRVEDS